MTLEQLEISLKLGRYVVPNKIVALKPIAANSHSHDCVTYMSPALNLVS